MEIYSKLDKSILLHKIINFDEAKLLKNQRIDHSSNDEFLQLSILNFDFGKKFDAHYHLSRKKYFESYWAQESWIVIDGRVLATYYDIDNQLITSATLSKGDISISFQGGHAYEILENSTLVYEIKTGPYEGVETDKRKIMNK